LSQDPAVIADKTVTTWAELYISYKLNAQILYSYNVTVLYMFQAVLCSSSGGQIVCIQHMVSSHSMSGHGGRAVHRLTENFISVCNWYIVYIIMYSQKNIKSHELSLLNWLAFYFTLLQVMIRRPLGIWIMMFLLLKHVIVVRIEYLKFAKEIYATW